MGTSRCGGHTVLAGSRFGDDPLLAHAERQQGLAKRVVDLVSAGVVQVFALQPDFGSTAKLRQSPCEIQWTRSPNISRKQLVELGAELGVLLGLRVFFGQLIECGDESFRNVTTAEIAESPE